MFITSCESVGPDQEPGSGTPATAALSPATALSTPAEHPKSATKTAETAETAETSKVTKPAKARRRTPGKPNAPFLAVRNGVFQFLRRWPADLLVAGLVKAPFKRESLRTSNPTEAQVLARRMAVDFDKRVAELRAELGQACTLGPAQPREVVRACDIEHLANRFEADLLNSDDEDRRHEMEDSEFAAYCDDIDVELKALRRLRLPLKIGVHNSIIKRQVEAAPPSSVARTASG